MLNLCLLHNFSHRSYNEVIERCVLVPIFGSCPDSYCDDTPCSYDNPGDNPSSTMTDESTKISGSRMYGSLVMSATGVVNILSVDPKFTSILDNPRHKLIVFASTCIYENVLMCVSIDANVYKVRMVNYIVQECMTEHRNICVRHPVGLREVSFMCDYETIMLYSSVFSYRHIVTSILMLCVFVVASCVCIANVNSVVTGHRYGTLAKGMDIVHGFVYFVVECLSDTFRVCIVSIAAVLLIYPEDYHSNRSEVSVLTLVHVYDSVEMMYDSCVCIVNVSSVVTWRCYRTLATGAAIVQWFVYITAEYSRDPNCMCIVSLAAFLLSCPENYHSCKPVVSVSHYVHKYDLRYVYFESVCTFSTTVRNAVGVLAPIHHGSLATAVCVYSFVNSPIGILWCAIGSLRPVYDVNMNNSECPFRLAVSWVCAVVVCSLWPLPYYHIQGYVSIDVSTVPHSSAFLGPSHACYMCFVCEVLLYCIPHGTKVNIS